MSLKLGAVGRSVAAGCLLAFAAALAAVWLLTGVSHATDQIVVDSAGDAANATPGDGTCDAVGGGCTLRAAIDVANSIPGTDTIVFNIPGDGPHTISPASPLPQLTESAIIDGYTQPGAEANTLGALQGTDAVLMIEIEGSNAGADANGIVVNGGGSTVRGLVINRFDGSGIVLADGEDNTFGNGNNVQGNFLGTDVTGENARGNGTGVTIDTSWWNIIGGTSPAYNNLVSGNTVGLEMTGNSMQNNVRNSIFGAARDGDTPLPNTSHGILLSDGALCNTIGGEQFAMQNIIAYNGGDGVSMEDGVGINNYVDPNEMHDNAGLGIDLNNDGVTPNDPDDLDSGPNDLQNYPVLTSARVNEDFGNIVIEGTLDSIPNAFMNTFFFLSDECDPSGYGEGFEFIGKELFNSGATGDHDFSVPLVTDAKPGQYITATVSSPESTSEFSECMPVTAIDMQYLRGDSNCDEDIGATDALSDLQFVAGFEPQQQPGCPAIGSPIPSTLPAGETPIFGDADCDGDVDATDALKVLQYIAGIPYTQTPPCTPIGDPLEPASA